MEPKYIASDGLDKSKTKTVNASVSIGTYDSIFVILSRCVEEETVLLTPTHGNNRVYKKLKIPLGKVEMFMRLKLIIHRESGLAYDNISQIIILDDNPRWKSMVKDFLKKNKVRKYHDQVLTVYEALNTLLETLR